MEKALQAAGDKEGCLGYNQLLALWGGHMITFNSIACGPGISDLKKKKKILKTGLYYVNLAALELAE